MYKLIIVDDEPLAQIGMKTMINYSSMDVEVVDTASNGEIALQKIKDIKPHIVITDIKMPIMDGLELIERCNELMSPPPQFIVLTSFEEFNYVRRAMRSNVVDYLVKMELNEIMLKKSLKKALEILKKSNISQTEQYTRDMFINWFLNRLLNNVFNHEQQINEKLYRYDLDFSGNVYVAVAVQIDIAIFDSSDYMEDYKLYLQIMNMVKTLTSKYVKSYVVAYSQTILGIIMCFDSQENVREVCSNALKHVTELCTKYFNISLKFGVGREVKSLMKLSTSFRDAQSILRIHSASNEAIQFYNGIEHIPMTDSAINVIDLNQKVIKSLETYDVWLFSEIIEKLIYSISNEVITIENAIDVISGIIHLIINNLDDGEKILHDAFVELSKSYRGIYNCTNKEDLIYYLNKLCKCIVEKLEEQKKSPKNKIVIMAQNYIKEHIYEKLSLNDVAHAINVSPNYLSSIFKKYSTHGFNDYVTIMKVRLAQKLLSENNLKVYEVSEMLGFGSQYYFSTVYKKITGFSPTETTAPSK